VIEAAIDERIEMVLAEPVLNELERVLTVKLHFEIDRVREIRALLLDLGGTPVAGATVAPAAVSGDPDDDVILACAEQAAVEIIVSGDRRHLLPVGEHRGMPIITPQALLAELAGEP
jgi:predicted nucleic acid-binding protein